MVVAAASLLHLNRLVAYALKPKTDGQTLQI